MLITDLFVTQQHESESFTRQLFRHCVLLSFKPLAVLGKPLKGVFFFHVHSMKVNGDSVVRSARVKISSFVFLCRRNLYRFGTTKA